MSVIPTYLARIRERYPMPGWIQRVGAFEPEALPTPYTLDAVIQGGKLSEWRIVFDPFARSDRGESLRPRSDRFSAIIGNLAKVGALKSVGDRVELLTINAPRGADLTTRGERLLLSAPWADGVKQNVDALRIGDLSLIGAPTLVTGPLGSGKSTYCRWLANKLATSRLRDPTSTLPIFVDLRQTAPLLKELAGGQSIIPLVDLMGAVLRTLGLDPHGGDDLAEEWTAGTACLLVDGLDEIGVVLRQKDSGIVEDAVARTLESLGRANSNVLVSCRPGTRVAPSLGFLEVEFAPLTVEEAVKVLQANSGASTVSTPRVTDLASAIPEELRTRPLFLSLVGRLMADDRLPNELTRWTVLNATLNELLSVRLGDEGQPSTAAAILGCEYESIVTALQVAAYDALPQEHQESSDLSIDQGKLMVLLYEGDPDTNVNRVIDLLTRDAGLMLNQNRKLAFAHRVFQEFLTAGYLARIGSGDREHVALLDALKRSPQVIRGVAELYVDRLTSDDRVNELLDLCNAALEAASLTDRAKDSGVCVWLAAIGLREVAKRGIHISRRDEVVVDNFVDSAADFIGDIALLDTSSRALVAEQVGVWGDRRDGVGLDRSGVPKHVWVLIPEAQVELGLDERRLADLRTRGIVNVNREVPKIEMRSQPLAIALFPTTWSQFRAFLTAQDGYANEFWWRDSDRESNLDLGTPGRLAGLISSEALGNTPVVGVDWYEADAYCRWLSKQLDELIDLPSEAEWEVAARVSTGGLFPWGDDFRPDLLNWAGTGLGRVIPVGCFTSSVEGAQPRPHDMIGNVWEWTSSIAGKLGVSDFSHLGAAPRMTFSERSARVIVRGGCYLNEVALLRATYRGNDSATARFDRQSFRVVRRNLTGRGGA